jgi:hypothetical protein
MSEEEILRMALDTGFDADDEITLTSLARFAALVAAVEREACAKVCEELRDGWLQGLGRYEFMGEGADFCADAIRAKGEK